MCRQHVRTVYLHTCAPASLHSSCYRKRDMIHIILAGGQGRNLWPLSRENHPKQFVKFDDEASLFQLTVQRLLKLSAKPSDLFIVSHELYRFTIANQLDQLRQVPRKDMVRLKSALICEPASRNTLPAVALTFAHLREKKLIGPDDPVAFFPSDHLLQPLTELRKALRIAENAAREGDIVNIGYRASSPVVDYGYIVADTPSRSKTAVAARAVKTFVARPTEKRAKQLLAEGAYWNTGIFVMTYAVFMAHLKRHQPGIARRVDRGGVAEVASSFERMPALSMDEGVFEKSRSARMVVLGGEWNDLGTWERFIQFYAPRLKQHRKQPMEHIDSRNCFGYSDQRMIGFVGLEDVVAIDSRDALLLVKAGHSDKVHEMVKALNKKGLAQSQDGATVYRPWGYYTVLHEGPNYKVKEIGVYPKKALSLQKHKFRSEHWNVVEGRIDAVVSGRRTSVKKNQSTYVPKGAKHRIINPTNVIARVIETQIGSYLGEDDIIRYTEYK